MRASRIGEEGVRSRQAGNGEGDCEADGQRDGAFHGKRGDGGVAALLLYGAVNCEQAGKAERDPRQDAVIDGEVQDAREAERHGDFLKRAQTLLEEHDAEQNGEKRIDVVSQGGVDDVTGIDGVNVNAPVQQHEDCGGEQVSHRPLVFEVPEIVDAHDGADQGHQSKGPDEALGNYLKGMDFAEQFPIQRCRAPHEVAQNRRPRSGEKRSSLPVVAHAPMISFQMRSRSPNETLLLNGSVKDQAKPPSAL